MGIITVEQIVSADGFAADEDGGIGFFEAVDAVPAWINVRRIRPVRQSPDRRMGRHLVGTVRPRS